MMMPASTWAPLREAKLRRDLDVPRRGGLAVALAVDLVVHDQDACDRFRGRLQQRRIDGWTGAPEGIVLSRDITLGKSDLDRNLALAALLVAPQWHPEDLGLNPPVGVRITPLMEAIRSGDLVVSGLRGPGSAAVRLEIVTEIDNLRALSAALGKIEADDRMIDPTENLEAGVARALLTLSDGPDPGFSVHLQRMTEGYYPEHRRPPSPFRHRECVGAPSFG